MPFEVKSRSRVSTDNPSDAATDTRPLEMLALSELNKSTDPPALTVISSVANVIDDDE